MCIFRKRFLKEIEGLFVQALGIAREMKLLKLGAGSGGWDEGSRQRLAP